MSRPWRGEAGEGEAQRIGAEGGDALGEFLAGALLDALRLFGIHQAGGALGDQVIHGDAVDQVDRVEHVALRLAHLVAVGIAHQTVT